MQKNIFLLLKKLKNTQSAQLCSVTYTKLITAGHTGPPFLYRLISYVITFHVAYMYLYGHSSSTLHHWLHI